MLIRKKLSYTKSKIKRVYEKLSYPKDLFNFGKFDEKYIRSYHGGLGDWLSLSTLPEEFYKQKKIKTYLLKSAKARNKEILDLILENNPYILRRREGPWNLGDHPKFEYRNIFNNIIMNNEYLHGLNPVNKYPKIYYQPKKILGLNNAIVSDLNSITVSYKEQKTKDTIRGIKKNFPNKELILLNLKDNLVDINRKKQNKIFTGILQVRNIFHYCDILNSAFGYLSFCSGGSQLSAAIKAHSNKKLESLCLIDQEVYNFQEKKGIYLFDNINYLKMKDSILEWKPH